MKNSSPSSRVFRLAFALVLCLCCAGGLSRPAAAQDFDAADSSAADVRASAPAVAARPSNVPAQDLAPGTPAGDAVSASANTDAAFPPDAPAPAQSTSGVPLQPPAQRADRCDIISATLRCFDDILHDQVGIWTAPRRIHRRDAIWLVPLAGAVVVSLTYDNATLNALGTSPGRVRFSNDFSDLGAGYTLAGAAGVFYLVGRLTHNERDRETGMVALEALADAGIVMESLKLVTDRYRPTGGAAAGKFWPDGTTANPLVEKELYTTNSSFPSGHATATWAVMHVLVDETPGHRWVHLGMYAIATGVSIARVTGRDHFPTDVIVGSTLGYLIGGYVYRQRSQFYVPHAKNVSVSPIFNAATGTYGVGVHFTP